MWVTAHLIASCRRAQIQAWIASPAGPSFVAGRGFGPEVKLGAVALHLPPEGEPTHADQGDEEQLLHDPDSFYKLMTGEIPAALSNVSPA
jgi:hypothetical protein